MQHRSRNSAIAIAGKHGPMPGSKEAEACTRHRDRADGESVTTHGRSCRSLARVRTSSRSVGGISNLKKTERTPGECDDGFQIQALPRGSTMRAAGSASAPQSTFSAPELPSLEKGPMHRCLKANNLWNRSVVGITLTPDILPLSVRSVTCRCFAGRSHGGMGGPTIPRGGCWPQCCEDTSGADASRLVPRYSAASSPVRISKQKDDVV